jgi:DNA-binding LacI/PurR family transcriptional regulator
MTTGEPATGRRRRVTAEDVARRSGVSRATVSYVLNNVPGQTILAATQARVRAAAAELGYVPSAAAASLRRGHSRIVLVVTDPALSGFVTEPFLAGIAATLTEGGYTPVTHQLSTEEAVRSLVAEIRPYGVLALTALSPGLMADITDAGVPRVYSSAQGDPSFPRPWEEEIGALQAHHLIEAGARRLVYAAPIPDNPRIVMAHSREIGAAAACTAAGIPTPARVELDLDRAQAIETLRAVIVPGTRTGISAFDDEVAAVALAATQALGFRIPEDVLVIGVDNAPFTPFLTPPLTTIAIDGRQTGRQLTERFLSDMGSAGADAVSHALATIIRRSSA